MRKKLKYIIVKICPMRIKGGSTGQDPMKVNKINVLMKTQKKIFFEGLVLNDLNLGFTVKGRKRIIKIDMTSAMTPPSLLGIERKIA